MALGLALWWREEGRRGAHRSTPAGLFAALALVLALGVVFCGSRGALALLPLPLATGVFLWFRRPAAGAGGAQLAARAGFVLLFAAFIALGLLTLHPERIWVRAAHVMEDPVRELRVRRLAWAATVRLARDRWLFGWGAGAFRQAFPLAAREYSEIYVSEGSGRKYWEHAHCDWLEWAAEYGLAGSLLGAAAGAAGLVAVVRRARSWAPLPVLAVVGVGGVLLHAGGDFVLQCPAVALTAAVMLAAAARWLEWRGVAGRAPTPVTSNQ